MKKNALLTIAVAIMTSGTITDAGAIINLQVVPSHFQKDQNKPSPGIIVFRTYTSSATPADESCVTCHSASDPIV